MVKINKPNLKFDSLTPINKNKVDKIVQHHMAHKSWHIKDVHNFHKNTNGWAGIGYNYWIDFKGNIYQGRGFNVGAHIGGHNRHTIGVGYQGDFTQQKMTDAQLQAGIELNKWLIKQLPNVSKNDIIGHNDLAQTACPGKHFRMTALKKGVGGKSKPSKPTKPTKPSTGDVSLVDYLKAQGKDASYSNRAKMAKQHGIKNYKGTAKQNTKLLKKLKGGTSNPSKTVSQMAKEIIDGKHGSGHANRRKSLGISKDEYKKVRQKVNNRLNGKSGGGKSISKMADEIIKGKHGDGHAQRRKSLGINRAQYIKVRKEVNKRL